MPGKKVSPPSWARQKFVSEFENQLGAAPPLLWSLGKLLTLCNLGLVFPDWSESSAVIERRPNIAVSVFKPELGASIEITSNRFYVAYRYGALAGIENEAGQDVASIYEERVVAPRYPHGYVVKTARIGINSLMEVAKAISDHK